MEERLKRAIAAVLGLEEREVTNDAGPGNIKNWDSLKQMQIMLALEDEFDVRFSDDEIHQLTSYRSILLALKGRVEG